MYCMHYISSKTAEIVSEKLKPKATIHTIQEPKVLSLVAGPYALRFTDFKVKFQTFSIVIPQTTILGIGRVRPPATNSTLKLTDN